MEPIDIEKSRSLAMAADVVTRMIVKNRVREARFNGPSPEKGDLLQIQSTGLDMRYAVRARADRSRENAGLCTESDGHLITVLYPDGIIKMYAESSRSAAYVISVVAKGRMKCI
jgi:hypothetical protein